ncbi:receptor-transporting protein 1-like [Pogona vitticeps]
MLNLDVELWLEVFKKVMEEVKPGDAWKLKLDLNLEFHQVPPGWKRSLQTHVRARFTCSQCHHRWTSHQAVILFHLRWERSVKQGRVKMKFFNQRCRECGSSNYEAPQFTEETILNVLVRLVFTIRKKCYREHVEDRDLREVVCHSGGPPHKEDYCEACQLGIHKGPSEAPQDGVPQDRTSPQKPQLIRQYTWSPSITSDGATFPRESQHREISEAIRVGESGPGHSETPQDGVSHGKTSPLKPKLIRQYTWSPSITSDGETFPWKSQHREISDALSQRAASQERLLTSSPRVSGRGKCCISCVVVVIILIAFIVLIWFLKNWF